MTPTVISYFPGSGGNRLARLLFDRIWWQSPGQHYHDVKIPVPDANFQVKNPYPPLHAQPVDLTWALEVTHCMSTELLRKKFPGRRIVKIKSHFVPSMVRCWEIWTQHLHRAEIEKFGLERIMNQTLRVHNFYYTLTGVDWDGDEIYDIVNGTDEFAKFMQRDLDMFKNTEFAQYCKQWQERQNKNLDFGY